MHELLPQDVHSAENAERVPRIAESASDVHTEASNGLPNSSREESLRRLQQ